LGVEGEHHERFLSKMQDLLVKVGNVQLGDDGDVDAGGDGEDVDASQDSLAKLIADARGEGSSNARRETRAPQAVGAGLYPAPVRLGRQDELVRL
jgi:hypothetical protein